jgi:hypothetical protein
MDDSDRTTGADLPPSAAMLRLIAGFWVSRAVASAAGLGIADLLREGPKSSGELAAATGTHAPSLYRLLRALASVGVFAEEGDGRFALTPLGATLQSGVPGSLRTFAMLQQDEEHLCAWGDLSYSLRTGAIAFDHCFGLDLWRYRARHPEGSGFFDQAMAEFTGVVDAGILAAYDFTPLRTVVDVGGGNGALLVSLLLAHPQMRGVLFDQSHVAAAARRRFEAAGLSGRCEVVAGDFFTSLPEGGDAYLLKWIIHDWDDQRAVAILGNCRRALVGSSRLLLIEAVIPPGNAPAFHKFMDLNMMVMTGGRERTAAEYRTLLETAGFRLARIVPTATEMNVIEAVPA